MMPDLNMIIALLADPFPESADEREPQKTRDAGESGNDHAG